MTHESHEHPSRPLKIEQEEYCPYCMSRVAPGQSCPACGLTQGAYTAAPHHLPLGTILAGRYLVGRALGEGGFGITYIGCDLRLEMKVAIKEYFPVDRVSRYAETSLSVVSRAGAATQDYDQGLKRFLYEARTMARMEKQPQIVMVRDYFEANHTAYIVMEYVEGTNFMQLTAQRGGRIAASELFPLIEPLFSALSAVHAAGLIHRDISPDNLMLERGAVRLLDFGCARESARGTETMTIALKQGYAPIEQYQRKGQGPWTDVYALSATIYYCLTGKVPPQSLDRILEDELIPPRDLGVEITPEQQAALLRGMEIQPRRRYQTVEELHAGLYHPETAGEASKIPSGEPALSEAGLLPEEGAISAPDPADAPDAPVTAALDAEAAETSGPRWKSWLWEHRRLCGAVCGGAAAAALILTAVLYGLPGAVPAIESDTSGVPGNSQPAALVSQDASTAPEPDRDALFAEAVTVTTLQEFADALADDAVSAIVCEGALPLQEIQDPSEQLEIQKPVLIAETGELASNGALLLREGGVLWTQGNLAGQGCLYTDGGLVVTDEGSEIRCTICLEQQADLVDYGAEFFGSVHTLADPALYAEAVTVTNGQEFRRAGEDPSTKAIRVDGEVELPAEFRVSVPVLVTETGSLTGEAGNQANLITSASLINYGTIRTGLQLTGEGARLVNYGLLDPSGGLQLGEMEDSSTEAAVNLGTLSLNSHGLVFCDLINIGTLSVGKGEETDGSLSLDQGIVHNYGRIEVAESRLDAGGKRLYNNGVLHIAGVMELQGLLKNNGSLVVASTGRFYNAGLIDCYDYDNSLTVEDGGTLEGGDGVLVTRTYQSFSGTVECEVWQADFAPIDGAESVKATVAGAQEFLDALSDPTVETVIVAGEVTLSEDLRLTKPVYVQGGALTMENSASLTVSGVIFCVNGTLRCDNLTLENGAMMELIGEWVSEEGASLRLTGKSWLYTRASRLDCSALTLEGGSLAVYDQAEGKELSSVLLSEGSTLIEAGLAGSASQLALTVDGESRVLQLCDFAVGAGTIALNSGSYFQYGNLSLGQVETTVGQESLFSSCYAIFTLGPEAFFENNGVFHTNQFTDLPTARIQGTLRNTGTLLLSGTSVEGTLENQGRICTYFDHSPIILSDEGKITGDDTVLLSGQWEL